MQSLKLSFSQACHCGTLQWPWHLHKASLSRSTWRHFHFDIRKCLTNYLCVLVAASCLYHMWPVYCPRVFVFVYCAVCILRCLYTALFVCCAVCMLCCLYTVLFVCCAVCILCCLYTVLFVCCAVCILCCLLLAAWMFTQHVTKQELNWIKLWVFIVLAWRIFVGHKFNASHGCHTC